MTLDLIQMLIARAEEPHAHLDYEYGCGRSEEHCSACAAARWLRHVAREFGNGDSWTAVNDVSGRVKFELAK